VHIYYNELWLVKNKTTTYCEQIDFLSSLLRPCARAASKGAMLPRKEENKKLDVGKGNIIY